MKLEKVFNKELLYKFMSEMKPLRVSDEDIATVRKKYVLILDNKLVVPGVFSSEGLKKIEEKGYFKKGNLKAYELSWTPIRGGPEDSYDEEGKLSPKSKKDLEDLWDRLLNREPS